MKKQALDLLFLRNFISTLEGMICLSVDAWKIVWETAPTEEIKYILEKTKIPIPGFRLEKIDGVSKGVLNRLIALGGNKKKIVRAYKDNVGSDMEGTLIIVDEQRRQAIKLLLSGDIANLQAAEDLLSKAREDEVDPRLATKHERNNSVIPDSEAEKWKKKCKAIENKMETKVHSLEKKLETKNNDANEFKIKFSMAEKAYARKSISLEKEKDNILQEFTVCQAQNKILLERVESLENDLEDNRLINQQLGKKFEELQERYDQVVVKLEQELNGSNGESVNTTDRQSVKSAQETELECEVKQTLPGTFQQDIKNVVVGKFARQENILPSGWECVDPQKTDVKMLVQMSQTAQTVFVLSWLITAAKRRKVQEVVPLSKLREFEDYNTFCEYIKTEVGNTCANI